MEEMFLDRLHEFYETLAYHFKAGQALHKAVEYLMKAGRKSNQRYALEEANLYFQEAFNLISGKPDRSICENELLVDTLNSWAIVQYLRGHFGDLHNIFLQYKDAAESIPDKAKIGMFYGWISLALAQLEKYVDAYNHLKKSLIIGEELNDDRVIAYALVFLLWTCCDLGRFDEADLYGKRILKLSMNYRSDHIIFAISRAGLATLNIYRGRGHKCIELGNELIDHGIRFSDARALFVGHMCCGYGD